MSTALYVIVDDRLSKSQRIPQAAHAVAEFMAAHGRHEDVQEWQRRHRTLVCLKADAERMDEICGEVLRKSWFADEDLGDLRTAVAVGPLTREEGKGLLSDLSLA